ncbi:short-subunit dehydrogenase [Novosphingobium sp. PhB165]|uniref:SDR family NAD(P)-dependent oxidoreductase n=1 Tax=Novosphingobium sp. PhB165 TaxID=2485105 RepID=UPI001053A0DF|nr:SDR family oxidoreductase [Novosphingobium sp. PhB165]TCM20598.1 short-subunit dehydrogenase [Novosphingobium sp. PhB165]
MKNLQGKTVFITGGGGGIGGGMAQAFAERGARIVLADIDHGFAQEEAAKLPSDVEVFTLPLDVRSLEGWEAARVEAEARFGAVDVLCNNAGISTGFKPLFDVSPEEFERVMAINVTGVYNGIQTFGPAMAARGEGHIVNTSSMNGLSPFASFAAYSASKFAVLALSDALRDELAPQGVGVSTLFPGLTRSRMSEADLGKVSAGDPARRAAIEANMMEAIWLGRAVVRAVENDEPYIVTHPDYREGVRARQERILAAFGEPAQPDYRTGLTATKG